MPQIWVASTSARVIILTDHNNFNQRSIIMKNRTSPFDDEEGRRSLIQRDWLTRYSSVMARIVPDPISTAVFMLILLSVTSLVIGNTLTTTVDAWYRGLWMLLPFTMQMTLIFLFGSVLAATPLFRKIIVSVSGRPRTVMQVIIYSVFAEAILSYLNWGLGLALGPLITVHFAGEAERKGLAIDLPFLLAVNSAAGSVWQYGLSASGPLMMATADHFLQGSTGIMPLSSTIWSPAAIFVSAGYPLLVILAARWLMPRKPRPLSSFPGALKLITPGSTSDANPEESGPNAESDSFASRLERHSLVPIILSGALAVWLYYHFLFKQASLDLNSLNTVLLLLCLLLHRSPRDLSRSLRKGVISCWPILMLYPLYAGIAGLIQFTTLGTSVTILFAPFSTRWTFPLLMAISGTVIAIFVPSSGGQWLIQGYVATSTAEAVGLTAQRGMLALGVGDQMGNLISPFWFAVRAEVAQIDFRTFFGYGLIFALLWFFFGVVVFTLLPC